MVRHSWLRRMVCASDVLLLKVDIGLVPMAAQHAVPRYEATRRVRWKERRIYFEDSECRLAPENV